MDYISSITIDIDDIYLNDDNNDPISKWYGLPIEISNIILLFMGDIDMCGVLKLVAKNSPFQPTELVYLNLCERVYLSQSSKKQISLTHFKLYKEMLINRPRLRTNGFYCLRTMYSKARCQDNFWEEKNLESIEVNYYRYFRFYDNGLFLYCCDVKDPDEVCNVLDNGVSNNSKLKIFRGSYTLQGSLVVVEVDVKLVYLSINFILNYNIISLLIL
jgi:hypothetical protein